MAVLMTGAGIIGCHAAALLAARQQSVVLLDRVPAHDPFPHVRAAASDISAAARELGWTPRHALRDAINHHAPVLS